MIGGVLQTAPMGPIFVGGASRSGKTLMRWILSSHPRIVVTRRAEMWPRFYGRFGDLGRRENFERCLRAMLGREQIASLAPDLERLRHDFWRGRPIYARLFALLHEQHAERSGKARWGDQTGLVERFTDELMSAYRGAKMVHLIRDPRDRHEAILERGPRRLGAVGRSTAGWISSVKLAKRNGQRYPGSYKAVRYEALVTRPGDTMLAVCDFLGEDYEPAMIRMEDVRRYREQRIAGSDEGLISTAYVGRYRRTISCFDLAFIQAVAGQQMVDLGYSPDPVQLSPSEMVRGATVYWPAGIAHMGSTRLLDALRRRPVRLSGYPESGR